MAQRGLSSEMSSSLLALGLSAFAFLFFKYAPEYEPTQNWVRGLPGWLATHGHAHLTLEEARTSPAVLESIEKAVERANRAVSRAESIRKFRILPGDLTIANGYLTPKLSIRRTEVIKDFAADIDALYETSDAHSD